MSSHTNRIEGFGCDGSQAGTCRCPAGHQLKPRKARAGMCGACRRTTRTIQDVMGCQRCNWYMCSACLTPNDSAGTGRPSLGGHLSQLVVAAKQEFSKALSQTDALMSGMSCKTATHVEAAESEILIGADPAVAPAPQQQSRHMHHHGSGGAPPRGEEQDLQEAIRRSLEDTGAGASPQDAEERDLQRAIAQSLQEAQPSGSGASSSSDSSSDGGSAAAPAPGAEPADQDDLIDLGEQAPASAAGPAHRRTIEEELLDIFPAAAAGSKVDCGPTQAPGSQPSVCTAELGG